MGDGDTSSRVYNMGAGDDNSGEAAMNMQQAVSSYYCNKINNFMPPSSYYNENQLHKHQASSEFGSESGGGAMKLVTGKVLFTATQLQELERQTMIYKYIMASLPIPTQLLIPFPTQSNRGMDLRFSNGSDPEPWRCRRTDGKKWRCSRDVAPDQKYCERHVHKSRPRSRKPVEIQPHTTTNITTSGNITSSAHTNTISTSSYQHPSWHIPVSSSTQQFQQPMNLPRVGSKRNHIFPQELESGNNNYSNLLDAATSTAGARRQNFIDAWSRSGGGDNCSLTLSMQCSGGIDDDDQNYETGVGILDVERGGGSGDVVKLHNQWLNNQSSWMVSPPGGPLGEALGLGIANTVKGPLNLSSPHGQNSISATTSSLCENSGSHGHGHELSFIR